MAYKNKSSAIKYNNDFISKAYDRINLTIPKGQKEIIQEAASDLGLSVNNYIFKAVLAQMERDAQELERIRRDRAERERAEQERLAREAEEKEAAESIEITNIDEFLS